MPDATPGPAGWYEHEGRKRYWDGSAWGAYWDQADAAPEGRESQPITFGTILLYILSLVIPVVGLVGSLVLLAQDRGRDAVICLVAGLAGFAAIWFGLR